jgi:hypothetical protein
VNLTVAVLLLCLYQIFTRKKLSVVKIHNRQLLVMVLAQVVGDAVLLTVWQVLSPMQPYTAVQNVGSNPVVVHDYTQCGVSGTGAQLFAVVCILKGLLLLFGALMAFSVRKVTSSFNESNSIALAIYNVVFSVGVVVPIALVIGAVGDVLVLLQLFLLLWVTWFALITLTVPKLLLLVNTREAEDLRGSTGEPQSTSAFGFASLTGFPTRPLLLQYVLALKEHLHAAEGKLNQWKEGPSMASGSKLSSTLPGSTRSSVHPLHLQVAPMPAVRS